MVYCNVQKTQVQFTLGQIFHEAVSVNQMKKGACLSTKEYAYNFPLLGVNVKLNKLQEKL